MSSRKGWACTSLTETCLIFPVFYRGRRGNQCRTVLLSFFETECRLQTVNVALGYTLLRDRRVSIRAKLMALGIGAAVIGLIELLQLPMEGVLAALLPFLGAAGDLALDGAEAVIGPVLIASVVLPHLAPADVVAQIRAETERMAGRRARAGR